MAVIEFSLVLALALAHFYAHRLKFLLRIPRSIWLSVAGGASVAYVILHLYPELHEGKRQIAEASPAWLQSLKLPVDVFILSGLVVYYGLERYVLCRKKESEAEEEPFWTHIVFFGLYNALVGHILGHQGESSTSTSKLLTFFAFLLHFILNDFALQAHHRDLYIKRGRWVLAGSILLGWSAGELVKIPQLITILTMAFLSGAIILNVFKEELPSERESNYIAFIMGAFGFGLLVWMAH